MKPKLAPKPTGKSDISSGNGRFRALLSENEWNSLSAEVRYRFSKPADNLIYAGKVMEARLNLCGWMLAQALRLVGGPLPTYCETGVPAVVTVLEERNGTGQIWTRLYARRSGFPKIIQTAKRFAGPTGLEEHLGGGIGMSLAVSVERGAIVFRSVHYFFQLLGRKWKLPALLSPGALIVTHAEAGNGRFTYTLVVAHPLFGELVYQRAMFREVASIDDCRISNLVLA
jgi:hypothetical protein